MGIGDIVAGMALARDVDGTTLRFFECQLEGNLA